MLPQTAYQIVLDEVMLDGNARFNLATFVTTWMDEEADRLYAATFDKNMIDKDEYPQTADDRGALRAHARATCGTRRDAAESVGTSTTGSSEGCMLAGLALKRRWQQARRAAGQVDRPAEHRDGRQRPGGVGEVRQLLGGRAALRAAGGRRLPPDRRPAARARRREHDRRRRRPRLDDGRQLRAGAGDLRGARRATRPSTGVSVPVHVDAASGGFIAPFLQPDLVWDFRLRAGGLDPGLGPQVRARLPGRRLGAVARDASTCPRTWSST